MRRIALVGGSGQVGTILARHFHARGDAVTVLSRRPAVGAAWRMVAWDPEASGEWEREVCDADVVINLAGRSVNCRYTAKHRAEILSSRLSSTRAIARALSGAFAKERVWLQSSTATIYAHTYGAPHDERSGVLGGSEPGVPSGWRMSTDVAKAWEAACMESDLPRVRRVLMRSAMVMSPDRGGIFDTLLTLVRRGLGGSAAGGRQFVSWIHEEDFARALEWLITHDDVCGPVNLASPTPLAYVEFMRELRRAAGIRIGLPATRLMLEIGALLMRTETELVLKSRRVVPGVLLERGFEFEYPAWAGAVRELVSRSPAGGARHTRRG